MSKRASSIWQSLFCAQMRSAVQLLRRLIEKAPEYVDGPVGAMITLPAYASRRSSNIATTCIGHRFLFHGSLD